MPTSDSTSSKVTFTGCEFKVANYFTEANTDPKELEDAKDASKPELDTYVDAWNKLNTKDAVHLHNATIRPFNCGSVTFEKCDFEPDMVIDLIKIVSTNKVKFINCTVGGKNINNASFNNSASRLLSDKGAVLTIKGANTGYLEYITISNN